MTSSKTVRLFTFGWSSEFVIRPLVEEGISEEDVIVLISSGPESDYAKKRAEEAYRQVEVFLKIARVSTLYYREVDISKDVVAICRDIAKIIKEIMALHSTGKLIFYLTGGMRVLVVSALIVARLLSLAGNPVEVRLSREDRPVSYVVPAELLKLDSRSLTKARLELLRYLRSYGEATFEDLAIRKSEITVRKLLTKLRNKGLVTYRTRGRRQFYKLTPLGELLLDVLG